MQHTFTTSEVSRLISVSVESLYRWLRQHRLTDPQRVQVGKIAVRQWTETDIAAAIALRDSLRRLRPARRGARAFLGNASRRKH